MRNILFLAIVFAFSMPVSASGLLPVHGGELWGNELSSIDTLDIPAALQSRVANPSDDYDPAADGIIADYSISAGFPYFTYASLILEGGITFSVEDRRFALKVGFLKGQYDDYVKTYKPRVVIFVSDITEFNPELSSSIYTVDVIKGESRSYSIPMDPYVDAQEKELEISCSNWVVNVYLTSSSGDEAYVGRWEVSELVKVWAKSAEAYAVQYNDRKIYTVPQLIPDYRVDARRFGFVLSEETPLYHTTGLPLDFVEVCRLPFYDGFFSYRPVSYSLPLALALEKLPEGNKWKLRDMDSSELTDALDQEAEETERSTR